MSGSNLSEVIGRLARDVNGLSFRGRGRTGTVAEDVQNVVAEIVIDRTVLRQQAPDGERLAPLADSTIERKRRLGYPDLILVETAEMLSLPQVTGALDLYGDHDMVISYGTDEWPQLKAEFAHEGFDNRPKRPFYAIGSDPRDTSAVDAAVAAGLDAQAMAAWGGGGGE